MEDLIVRWGLLALFTLMLLDNVGVPFPSEVPLLYAGFLVSDGRWGFVESALVGATGSLAGALIFYALGRWVGRAVVHRWGRLVRVGDADLDRAEAWFHRRGELSVLYLRVVPLVRTLISIPAGMLEMHPLKFVAYTLTGSLAWCLIVIGIGWGLGDNYRRVTDEFSLAQFAAVTTIGMLVAIWVVKRALAARGRRAGRPPEA